MNIYKKWILNTFLVTLLASGGVAFLYKNATIFPIYTDFKHCLNNNIETVFLGASHAACGFDPEMFPSSANLGKSGEPLLFTYYKLRLLLNDNPQIKHVVLAFSPIHISEYQDSIVYGGNSNTRNVFLDYYFLLKNEADDFFSLTNEDYLVAKAKFDLGLPLSYMRDFKLLYHFYRGTLRNAHFNFWGKQEKKSQVHLEPEHIHKKIQLYFYKDGVVAGLSNVAITHFKKIAALCEQHHVKLTIIRTPEHADFYTQIPDYFEEEYQKLLNETFAQETTREIMDFQDMKLPDACFLDGDHLNVVGSRRFTKQLYDSITSRPNHTHK